jgi:hypothetical protein
MQSIELFNSQLAGNFLFAKISLDLQVLNLWPDHALTKLKIAKIQIFLDRKLQLFFDLLL